MPKTTVDVDPELLAAAKARLGTSTIKDTINAALREIAERGEREQAIDSITAMITDGDLDWEVLEDKQLYRPTPGTSPKDSDVTTGDDGPRATLDSDDADVIYNYGSAPSEVRSHVGNSGKISFADVKMSQAAAVSASALQAVLAGAVVASRRLTRPMMLDALTSRCAMEMPVLPSPIALRRSLLLGEHDRIDDLHTAIRLARLHHSSLGSDPDERAAHALQTLEELLQEAEGSAPATDTREAAE
ncbi:hypothetical protein [Streptomyces sp. NBC_01602]|uniref:hypothetical protein n=1 Tax=Streptomyces sp. NBC_01602 TaxID=2975893 RepID=UPI00386B8BD1